SVGLAYLIGSIPFAWLIARRHGMPDLRLVGSGNVGAANVVRVLGRRAGSAVAILDIAKGAAAIAVALWLTRGPSSAAPAGFAALVGHSYPIWLRFRGGKGVATACGVGLVLTPLAVLPAVVLFAVVAWVTGYVSVASLL